jgi:hypothetical protein
MIHWRGAPAFMPGVWARGAGTPLTQIKDGIISFDSSVFFVPGEVRLTAGE